MLNRAFRTALCAGALLLALCLPASAAQEGDFSVLVNGEAVTFTDAAPLLKDGRSFLPMVETFDALGFAQGDITWDAATRSVTAAKDGTSITLTIDQKELTVTRGQEDAAETDTITTDAAPFIDAASSRTYVPVGLVAGALGYNVGWDAQTSTVIIDDVDAILAANSETYAMMDRHLQGGGQSGSGDGALLPHDRRHPGRLLHAPERQLRLPVQHRAGYGTVRS